MKTHSPLVILLLWLMGVIISAIILHSCNSCELDQEYTVAIGDARVIDMHGPLWSTYTPGDVENEVMANLRSQLSSTNQLLMVTGAANVHIYIDSIHTDSYEWDESKTDPCYGDHNWIYQAINPPNVYTYRLRKTDVTIVYTVVDSVHMTYGYGRAQGTSTEWLQQPQGDSTQCFQYEVVGSYDHSIAMRKAAGLAVHNFKCEIKKMMEP